MSYRLTNTCHLQSGNSLDPLAGQLRTHRRRLVQSFTRSAVLDLDLSLDNLPAGSLLAVGQAVLQVSEALHLGCAKFVERFGGEAMRFVNSRVGRQLRLRGLNARVVVSGTVRLGDLAAKAPAPLGPGAPRELSANS